MHLYLVQHGLSRPEEEDPDRPLSETGKAQTRKMARFAAAVSGMSVERILHSGKERARQTAAIMAAALAGSEAAVADGLEPLADPDIWAKRLEDETTATMLVGHLPHLDRLAAMLLTGNRDRSIIRFANAGIVALRREPEKGWQMAWMVTPDIVG